MSANPPLPSSTSPVTHRAGGLRPLVRTAVVVGAVVLAAVTAGIFIGRSTTPGTAAAPSWAALPPAPIAGRIAESAVWTGKEMIIWGGVTRTGTPGAAADGAAFDPAARAWRAVAPAPAGVRGGGGNGAAWTGEEMVVFASNSPDGPVGAAAYDPARNTWRRLPSGPLGRREGYSSVWTGKELILVGGALGDTLAKPVAAALDPRAGSWRLLPALNRLRGLMPGPGVAWDGHELSLLGSVCAHYLSSCKPVLLAYDPATDTLRRIDLAKAPVVPEQQLTLVGRSGSELVFTTVGVPSNVKSGRIAVIRYDPATGRWRKGAFARFPGTAGVYQQTAFLGDRFVAPDGSSSLQIYDLGGGRWKTISPGPSPLNSRAGSAIVWTGDELIAWSGSLYERFNPTPSDGASLRLGRKP